MNKLLVTLSFLISIFCLTSHSWALPPCPTIGYKHNCYGMYTWSTGDKYEGEFMDDAGNGQGTYTHISGAIYIGKWKKMKRHGHGIETWKDGKRYVGEHKNNKRHGQGISTFPNGDEYIGEYKYNQMDGKGMYTFGSKSKRAGDKFSGEFKDGKRNGQGKYIYSNGTVKEGIWKNDKFVSANKPTYTPNPKIEWYKSFCSEIGFTPGTEKFGKCVVEAMKKG